MASRVQAGKMAAEPLFDGLRYARPAQESRITVEAGASWVARIALLACMGLALAFVLALADALIEAAGSRIDRAGLESIAAWSEVAVALVVAIEIGRHLVIPMLGRTAWGWARQVFAVLLLLPVLVAAIAFAESELLQNGLNNLQAAQGRAAVRLYVRARAALDDDGKAALPGISSAILHQPDGRTFLGLAPLAMNEEGVDATAALRALTSRRVGTAAQMYDDVFVPSVRNLRDAYNSYAALQADLVAAIRAIPGRQDDAWKAYTDSLHDHGLTPAKIAPADRVQAIDLARKAGVNVPDSWIPGDKSDFATTAFKQFRAEADATYAAQVKSTLGVDLPPGLDFQAFSAQDAIQARWRSGISAPPNVLLAPDMGLEAFAHLVYEPELDQIMQPQLAVLNAPASDFASGGRLAEQGRAAIAWAVIPCAALVLVFLCCAWLTFRIAGFVIDLLVANGRARPSLKSLAAAAIILFALGVHSSVTQSSAYRKFETDLSNRFGPGWLLGRGMIQSASAIAPAGRATTNFVFGGFDFGVRSNTSVSTPLDSLVP